MKKSIRTISTVLFFMLLATTLSLVGYSNIKNVDMAKSNFESPSLYMAKGFPMFWIVKLF